MDIAGGLALAAVVVGVYGFPILILVMIGRAWRRSQIQGRARDAAILRMDARLDGLERDVAEILSRLGPARR
jgi:hypothetical protein